jgi:hypothetical protein
VTPADEALVDRVPVWFHDPHRYVLDAFDWGVGELAAHPGPDDWQSDVLRDLGAGTINAAEAIRLATASGHGIGKSALVAWIILWAMSTRPHLNGTVTANTGTQLETKTWRELAVWHKRAINSHWFRWTATRFYQVDHPETWFVAAIPWAKERSEAFAGQHGEHVLVIYDEASAVDDVIWEVSEGAMTTAGAMWCVFGNPTRNTGRFRECFGRFRHRWITRQIDSRTARMANKAQLEQWVTDYGEDSDFVRIRVRGVFPRAGSMQFIASDLVEAAQARRLDVKDPGAPLVLGIDLARFGDDQCVIRGRAGRDGRAIAPIKWRGMDTVYSAGRIAEAIEHYHPEGVFIDGGGVGGGVIDILKARNFRVIEVNFGAPARNGTKYYNKRAEMWGDLRDWLGTGTIDADTELQQDLIGPEYGFDKDSRVQLEKKDDMKKRGLASPDNGDALALTFAHPVARKDMATARHSLRRTQQSNTEYKVI